MARVLVIADTQHPFDHDDYLPFLLSVQKKYKTEMTVHVGDEIDHAALSDYDSDPDGYSAGHELQKAIDRLQPYYKAFPKLLLCESNHRERILKRAFKSGISKRYLKEFKEVIEAPQGWKWAYDHEIEGILYKHGLGYSGQAGALNAAKDAMKPCVIGHLHSEAGVLFWSNGKVRIFGMNVGCGMNSDSYAAAYGRDSRKKPILSCGVVLDKKPYVIIMHTVNGKWDGEC